MSGPSTPRTARSASPTNGSPAIFITPGRKIKAILAAFDSESDNDSSGQKKRHMPSGIDKPMAEHPVLFTAECSRDQDGDEDQEDEDDDIFVPRGRMAARMQASSQNGNKPKVSLERISDNSPVPRKENAKDARSDDGEATGSDNDIFAAILGRKGKKKSQLTKNVEDEVSAASPFISRARSFSPLFVSSPARVEEGSDNERQSIDLVNDEDVAGEENGGAEKPNSRFLALVAKKRKECEEAERIEEEKKAARAEKFRDFSSQMHTDDDDSADNEDSERKLTQHSRPGRRTASKKALEEMNRETQRISRNMQLAHQAVTKKKITKESFFARFNSTAAANSGDNSSTTAGSQNTSDVDTQKEQTTPSTSPMLGRSDEPMRKDDNFKIPGLAKATVESIEDFPDLDELTLSVAAEIKNSIPTMKTGVDALLETQGTKARRKRALTKPAIRVFLSRHAVAQHQKEDSDSDLEVVTSPAKCRRITVFENLPSKISQEPTPLLKLKALAHLTSPTRRSSSIARAGLSATLLHHAKLQAAKERQERIQELRAKGIIIETAEERAAIDEDVENLIERARKEAAEIAKKEKENSKQDRHESDDGDDDDEDYEFSGSDDEEVNNDDGDDEESGAEDQERKESDDELGLFDNEAGEADDSEDDQTELFTSASEHKNIYSSRRKRRTRIISDDEDEEQGERVPALPTAKFIPKIPQSAERPEIPGLSASKDALMSLTQAFAGTLGQMAPERSAILPSVPDPTHFPAHFQEEDSEMTVNVRQGQAVGETDLLAGYAHSEARISESPAPRSVSNFSQIPDPTQDAGFLYSPFDPTKRFLDAPPGTVDTVLISQNYSPGGLRQGKHLRRGRAARKHDSDEDDVSVKANVFGIMRKAAKKLAIPFEKNKSAAKEMVEEAAEESDDEYAGIGGASDDSEAEGDAYDTEMINDNSGEVVNEKELAALNVLHQKAADEKQVAKLFKDLTTGALRRRRGADTDFDLDDSDDERLARRRQKQREFARMRKALLADEKVGELADNPKKAAFFKAIQDHDSDDDFDVEFLDKEANEDNTFRNTSLQQQQDPASKETNKRKRSAEPSAEDIANRSPPHLRRSKGKLLSKKASTLDEIREAVSFLTEAPDYDSFQEVTSVPAEGEEEQATDETEPAAQDPVSDREPEVQPTNPDSRIPAHPRRIQGRVVDRLALLRHASSNSASTSANTRLAFFAGESMAQIGFRPPPLLCRTTTSSSSASSRTSSSSASSTTQFARPVAAAPASMATKGSVNYYTAAREREREREIRAKQRLGASNTAALLNRHARNGLWTLGKGNWE